LRSAALAEQPGLRRNFQRMLAWLVASGDSGIAGGLSQGTAREGLWLAAVVVDLPAPRPGSSPPAWPFPDIDWTITGQHLAHRCQLFLIVAWASRSL
jgi:low temperature requirement protein LtrA